MVKLIIWDIDGVLWKGSITEGGETTLDPNIVAFIQQSEKLGIIHSICSINNLQSVRKKLSSIWDLFVFPSINLEPKGHRVKQIIENCQLRDIDVVFIDDNVINTNEATFYCPNLTTYNNSFTFINNVNLPIGKSRTNFYKILEQKHVVKSNTDNISFLKDSDIHIAIVERYDNIPFQDRIEELVNRSNQLNYSKTIFDSTQFSKDTKYKNGKLIIPSSAGAYILRNDVTSCSVFVWDKYGYYGLVGFISIETKGDKHIDVGNIVNFVFSCRVINMHIENKCLEYLKQKYPVLLNVSDRIQNLNSDFITLHDYQEVKNYILEKENLVTGNTKAIILANCLSPAYASYSKHVNSIQTEIWYKDNLTFHTDRLYHGLISMDGYPNLIVFAAYLEFVFTNPHYWNIESNHTETYFNNVIDYFSKCITDTNRKALIILPSNSTELDSDIRYQYLYNAWTNVSNPNIDIIYMPNETVLDDKHPVNFTNVQDIEGIRKYSRKTMHDITKQIDEWLDSNMLS